MKRLPSKRTILKPICYRTGNIPLSACFNTEILQTGAVKGLTSVCVCDTGPAHVQSPIRRKDMRSAVFWPGEFWLMHELDVIKRPIILFARCERVRQPGYIA